ncbi:MAG: prolipoprotein diacylglyceryl transferase [Acidobacteria bacterium]|nr:prolipoprotein diacylglyceryl transferase [Acidobacteriota bacterium]
MFPELFKIPYLNFTIYTYGLLVALSFIVGLWVMSRLAARDGLDKQKVYDLGLWVLVASLVGSKLLLIITEWNDRYSGNIGAIFSLDFLRSNGVFYGGFIGAVIASVIVMRKYNMPWWRTADAFAPGIAIGHFIGRLGCFSAGCCWGEPTTAWCGVHFTEKGYEATGVPTIVSQLTDPIQQRVWADKLGSPDALVKLHPTQLYEAAALLVIFIVLLVMFRHRKFHGQIVLAYALLYATARFIVEFWRDDPRGELLNLSTSQFIAVLLFIGALVGLFLRLRSQAKSASPQSAT